MKIKKMRIMMRWPIFCKKVMKMTVKMKKNMTLKMMMVTLKTMMTKMLMTIKRLEVLIKSPEDNASDIEKLVSAAARSFSVVDTFNFPGEPIGYTGKVGTTTTAGKSLE